MDEATTTTAETMPATPIRMYVVEEVMPNGEIFIGEIGHDVAMAQDFARMINKLRDDSNDFTSGRLFVRLALLHYDRPRMAYGEIRPCPSYARIAEEDAKNYPQE